MSSDTKISSELAARVHWSLGRCHSAAPPVAAQVGTDLITEIEQEIARAFHRGTSISRSIAGGGSSDTGLPAVAGGESGR